jgi:hypothetical protein
MIASSWDDSQSWDEAEHLTSGYLCLAKQRFQVNCWHPPLMKDIAATPLLFSKVNAPPLEPGLSKDNLVLPWKFMYESGNDPQSLLRAARTSLILVVAGFYAYFFFCGPSFLWQGACTSWLDSPLL